MKRRRTPIVAATAVSSLALAGTLVAIFVTVAGGASSDYCSNNPSDCTTQTLSVVVTAPLVHDTVTVTTPGMLWSADMETGDLSQWSGDGLGGEYNTGTGDTSVTGAVTRSGRYAMALSIRGADGTTGAQATRNFRWGATDVGLPESAYYSAWFYFPRAWTPTSYWNIFQWKTKVNASTVLPTMILNVGCCRSGRMYVYLYDKIRDVTVGVSPIDLPAGQWVFLEAYYKHASDATGQVTFWQNARKIIDAANMQTQYDSADPAARQWSIDNYTSGLSPPDATIYVDDAVISSSWIP